MYRSVVLHVPLLMLLYLKKCPNVEYSKEQKAPSWKEHHIKYED